MTSSILTVVFTVFSEIGDWLISAVGDISTLFWVEGFEGSPGSLTFLGVLAVCGLGFSVVFLLIGLIQRFLHFRG